MSFKSKIKSGKGADSGNDKSDPVGKVAKAGPKGKSPKSRKMGA